MLIPLPPPLPPADFQAAPAAWHESAPDMPVVISMPDQSNTQQLVVFEPGKVACETGVPAIIREEIPLSVIAFSRGKEMPKFYTLHFSIDATGRPLSIKQEKVQRVYWVDTSDLAPAFATWQFAASAPQTKCTITFNVKNEPFKTAAKTDIYRHIALPHKSRYNGKALFARSIPAGSTCFKPNFPMMRVRVFPDFREIPQSPGTVSYSFMGFDLDEDGVPINVELLSSGGNRVMDKASSDSLKNSRFLDGARTGCTYRYYRTPSEPVPPPPIPAPKDTAVPGSQCNGVGGWHKKPKLNYPANFRKRWIEGWAVIKFDVAPWGATGNISVVKAEPSEAFGEEALKIISQASKKESKRGYSGCTERVRFKMPDYESEAE